MSVSLISCLTPVPSVSNKVYFLSWIIFIKSWHLFENLIELLHVKVLVDLDGFWGDAAKYAG